MAVSSVKTSISKGKGNKLATKFSISYIRVSSLQQTKVDKSGIRRQEQEYIRWLDNHPEYKNLDGVEFRDLGVSGRKNIKSGALGIFLKMAEKGEIPPNTCLVVESMSRLTRDCPYDGIGLARKIWDLGHTIAFTQGRWNGDVITGKERGIFGQIESALDAASWEWEDKRARVMGWVEDCDKKLENRDLSFFTPRQAGKHSTMYPFWLDYDPKINDFIVIEKWGNLIQRMFEMGLMMGAKKISHILKAEGIRNSKGEFFSDKTIRQRILDNRQVLGEKVRTIKGKKKVFKSTFPAIITPELFDQQQVAKEERINNPNKNAPNRKMVNLFQGVIFCSECGGNMQVAKKDGFVCKNRNEKNGEKIQINYHNIYCDTAVSKRTCNAPNSAPYRQLHRDIDNELVMLEQISNFRWESLFTDEKHEKELKVQIDKRTRFLNQSNKLKNQINNYLNAEKEYIATGRALPEQLEELKNRATQEKKEADKKYGASENEIQNIKRRRTGLEQQEHIQKRVTNFIKKGRKIDKKREEFNLWLKEIGIAFEVWIEQTGSNPRQRGNANYRFSTGVGMYDVITGKFRGLNQVEEAAVAFGMDLKQVREVESKQYEFDKKQSLEVGRDIRFPTEEQRKRREESSKRFRENITVAISQGPALPPDWIGAPDDHEDYWFNVEKEAGRLNRFNFPTRWINPTQ